MKIEYNGLINYQVRGENDDAVYVGDTLLAEAIADDIDEHGRYLSVRYFITVEEKTWDEAVEDLIRHVAGVGEARYEDRYSDITGYLWTEEDLVVGGHDLMDEITDHIGKYLLLEIVYSHTEVGQPETPV